MLRPFQIAEVPIEGHRARRPVHADAINRLVKRNGARFAGHENALDRIEAGRARSAQPRERVRSSTPNPT